MLDTNMCIYLIKNQPPEVVACFAKCCVGEVVMSAITYAELEYGVAACINPQAEHVKLKAATRESKKESLNKLIVAHAVSIDAVLVTDNLKDFKKYPGLKLENWVEN